MSERDREFLRAARLKISDAARLLDVKPQAVSQGLARSHDYLTGERLVRVAEHAMEREPSLASALARFLPENFVSTSDTTKVEPVRVKGLLAQDNVSSLWIFSSSPLELEVGLTLEEVIDEFFVRSDFSIVYFVPPRVSLKLRGLIEGAILRLIKERNLDPASLAHIEIVECAAIDLVPHFAIANPLPTPEGFAPRGSVVVGERSEEAALPAKQVQQILQVLYANRVGVDPNTLVAKQVRLPNSEPEWGGLSFISIFNSRDLAAQKGIERAKGGKVNGKKKSKIPSIDQNMKTE